MTWSYSTAICHQGVGREVECRLWREHFAMNCCPLDDLMPLVFVFCFWICVIHSVPSLPSISQSRVHCSVETFEYIAWKMPSRDHGSYLFLRDKNEHETRGTVGPKIIPTVRWGGTEQRERSLAGSRWKASGRRWPASVVSWQTKCSCPRWGQRALRQPHCTKAGGSSLPVNKDKEEMQLEGYWACGRAERAGETLVGIGGGKHFNQCIRSGRECERPLSFIFLDFSSVARKLPGGHRSD